MPNCPQCNIELTQQSDQDSFWQCTNCSGVLIAGSRLSSDWQNVVSSQRTSDAVEIPPTLLNCTSCATPMQYITEDDVAVQKCVGCNMVWMSGLPAESAIESSPADAITRLNRFMLYGVSLPERAVRSAVGLAAGAAKETATLLVPQSFQTSKSYELLVKNSLQFLTENIGGVKGEPKDEDEPEDEGYLARKTVGNFVDLAGLATLHVSPVWFMAIVSDVAYGSKTYLNELAVELKKQGVIDGNSTINQLDDILAAVQNATGEAASLFDTPPLSVDQLKLSLDNTREALKSADYSRILPEHEITQYWQEMREIAQKEGVSLTGVSGALTMHALEKVSTISQGTLTGVQVVGGLFSRHVVGHYLRALEDVKERGFYEVLHASSAPYVEALWSNFSDSSSTWTQEVLSGRAIGKAFNSVTGWFRKPKPTPDETTIDNGKE